MRLSRWAIIAPIPGRNTSLVIQPLSGEAALVEAAKAEALSKSPLTSLPDGLDEAGLRDMRILVDSADEDARLLADARKSFAAEMERTPTQLIVVPTFACNLACTYCYQEAFESARGLVEPAVIDAFFAWIDRFHAHDEPRPYITLFGGEPLVDTPGHHDRLRRYLDGARARRLDVAVVTNSYDLEAFVAELSRGPVREVQVTIDGPQSVHDGRRPHGSGGATFEKIVRGIDAIVATRIPVNLRIVVDRSNLPALPDLARFADDKGWLTLPESRFKTQVGRNYELFGCAAGQKRADLYERAELWAAYVELAEREPVLRKLYRPRFHGIGHLADTGELPAPNFDGCPATKKEWAFGPDGTLYGCTATVGNPRHRLGRYYPEVERDEEAIAGWRARSTLTIDACAECALAPMCGGGCGAIAAARTGSPMKPDCRPVRELLGLGARFYGLDELDDPPGDTASPPAPSARQERHGCLGCGADLVYLLKAQPMVCAGCGKSHPSRARCERGHYYCDRCHSSSAVEIIEQVCLSSTEHNPLALALAAMRHPQVNMHGPEHHFLVPAVLVAAWCNLSGEPQRKAALLAEARHRSEPVLGGFCGFQGACGAGVGVGIFVSIASGSSPLKGPERGLSIRATSNALKVIGGADAPRCCKRDVFLGLLSGARFAGKHLGIDFPTGKIRCEWSHMNLECIGSECSFNAPDAAST